MSVKLLEYKDYKNRVEEIFSSLSKELSEAMPYARIEHIGSSSIPNSLSKGDLDIFVGVPSDSHELAVEIVKSLGFKEKIGTFRSNELCMLVTDKFNHDVAVQLIANNSRFEDFIRFRDVLRSKSELLKTYNDIKLSAYNLPVDKYREEKSKFINHVLSLPFIRDARLGDEVQIHRAHMRSIREICVKDHGEDEIRGWGNRPFGQTWTEAITKNEFVKVIEFNSEVHGVGYLRLINSENQRYGYLHALYFTPDVTGIGLGSEMMFKMLEHAKSLKIKSIKLDSSITALNFYKRFGFVENGPQGKVIIGGSLVTCYPMICYLELS